MVTIEEMMDTTDKKRKISTEIWGKKKKKNQKDITIEKKNTLS